MIHTLYQEKNGHFKTKAIEIIITAHLDNNSSKKLGVIELNLSDYCSAPVKDHIFPLKDCFDKNAKLCMSISAKVMTEGTFTDTLSELSGPAGSHGSDECMSASIFSDEFERMKQPCKPPLYQ